MALLRFALALLLAGADALLLPGAAGAVHTAGRAAAPCMKHNEYFTRVQRAEAGRLRLCVYK